MFAAERGAVAGIGAGAESVKQFGNLSGRRTTAVGLADVRDEGLQVAGVGGLL